MLPFPCTIPYVVLLEFTYSLTLCVGLLCGSATRSQLGVNWRHGWPRPSFHLRPNGWEGCLPYTGLGAALGVLLIAESQVLDPGHACDAAHSGRGPVPVHMQHVPAASGDAVPLQWVRGESVKRLVDICRVEEECWVKRVYLGDRLQLKGWNGGQRGVGLCDN